MRKRPSRRSTTRNRGRYGYWRITVELRYCSFGLNHKPDQRMLQELDLVCRVRMKKYKPYKSEVGKIGAVDKDPVHLF